VVPAPDPALLLDNQLCFALYSTSLAMTKLYKPLLAALALIAKAHEVCPYSNATRGNIEVTLTLA
jgi:organic hydroperoxide reductase OsmC/OhrA